MADNITKFTNLINWLNAVKDNQIINYPNRTLKV